MDPGSPDMPSSKVWHRCRSKPPNCRLARAARVVCAQPGTVFCSQTPLLFVGAWGGWSVYVDSKVANCIDIKAWLDHHSLLLISQIKWTLKYLSIRYILQITRHRIISTNFYLFKPPACSIFQYGGPPPPLTLASLINISNNYTIIINVG